MPPYPGEERLVTVFADIHYYFAQPTRRPLLHRFDKASYFYIYYNSTRHTSRIEVANNPGTSDQDAFNGYIDTCRIINSYRFPTLLTIEVDGVPTSPSSPKSGRDPEEWRLASADPRDANRTKYKLHTLDIYFWALEDARLVIECFKKLLPSNQLDVAELDPEPEREPHQEPARSSEKPANAMSPVVQNLENIAITDAYNGQQKAQHAASPTSSFISHNIPPPPLGGPSGPQIHSPSPAISDLSSQYGTQSSVQTKSQSADFTPMAYNPAAPAAPEPIAHREKTPPPPDAGNGTGLAQAAKHDQGYIPGPPPQQQQQQQQGGYQIGQGPPVTFGGGYASPPPQQPQQPGYSSPHQSQSTAYASPPQSSYSQQDPRSSMASTAPSFGPAAPSTLGSGPRHSTAAETYVPQRPAQPQQTPSNQFYDSLPQTRSDKPLSHVQPQYADYLSQTSPPQQSSPQPPPGGYNQYQYGSSAQQTQQLSQNPYDIHQQVYRPTEAEANPHHHKKPSKSSTGEKKDSRLEKAEKGVGRLFKRIEKKIG